MVLSPKSEKQVQKLRVSRLRFIGEQDGLPERELKARLTVFFRRNRSVKRAYLAKVMYGSAEPANVALCLCKGLGPDDTLAHKVGSIFSSMFGTDAHMDIVFVNDAQESALSRVCPPFFIEPETVSQQADGCFE
jgi:hypothetical protein